MSDNEFNSIEKYIEKCKKRGKFEIKKIHPKHRRYIKEWIGVEKKIEKNITNKNIMVVDDYITSGSTLDSLFLELDNLRPKNKFGLSIMKSR